TEHGRQRSRVPLVTDDCVCVADAGGDHAHRDFVSTRFIEGEFADIQISLRRRSDCSIDLHYFLLIEQAENNWPQSSVHRPLHRGEEQPAIGESRPICSHSIISTNAYL